MAINSSKKRNAHILVADDSKGMRELMGTLLGRQGLKSTLAANGDEALSFLRREHFDLVISDESMPGARGIDILKFSQNLKPVPPLFILVTGQGTFDMAVEAFQAGAHDCIQKPFKTEEFTRRIHNALDTLDLEQENRKLRQAVEAHYAFPELIGNSKTFIEAVNLAHRAAEQSSPVLLLGESGTGKDVIARAIHFNSSRERKPFIAINCGAIPEELIESEFFGHKRGSFTGAVSDRRGCFEEVAGGTLFLDEIGEMPIDLQVKLLRVLEEKKIKRVGENIVRPVDFRIIAATNRALSDEVANGRFRQDLYYRLNVLSFQIPPLRERREDIPILAKHFLDRMSLEMNTKVAGMNVQTEALLQEYDFPGNVRELINILQRAILLCDGEVLEPQHLPAEVQAMAASLPAKAVSAKGQMQGSAGAIVEELSALPEPDTLNLKEEMQRAQDFLEKRLIERALQISDGNHSQAANLLGISRGSLYNKLRRFQEQN